jgi:Raf kinase inhibitor-like YbhB/YbcL family protein
MKLRPILACLLTLSCSREGNAGAGNHLLAGERAETQARAGFGLSSSSFPSGGTIPLAYSAYGDNRSPALAWSALPAGTKSLALLVEDPDAASARPFVHWLAWNIDPAAGRLPEGTVPAGTVQGRNSRGTAAWFGPRPHGPKPHHYHFQLFALDAPLNVPGGTEREPLLAAMRGHVVAQADLVGLFAAPRARK